jgi:hypothetical protein
MDDQPEGKGASLGDEVELHAPDIDVDAAMVAIRHNIQRRREEGLYQVTRFSEFEEVTCPEEPGGDAHDPLLYFHLRQVNQSYTQFHIDLSLNPSRLAGLPLVGSLWDTVRLHLHSLAIFYVNKLIEPMIAFNRHIVTILNILTRHSQKRDAELFELRQRVAELEARLAHIEENA